MKSQKKNFVKLATALLVAGVLTSGPAFAVRGTQSASQNPARHVLQRPSEAVQRSESRLRSLLRVP